MIYRTLSIKIDFWGLKIFTESTENLDQIKDEIEFVLSIMGNGKKKINWIILYYWLLSLSLLIINQRKAIYRCSEEYFNKLLHRYNGLKRLVIVLNGPSSRVS